jgi:hypothetical protein
MGVQFYKAERIDPASFLFLQVTKRSENLNEAFQIAPNAIEAQRVPGKPYYFKCNSKIFMGIMVEVFFLLRNQYTILLMQHIYNFGLEEYRIHIL